MSSSADSIANDLKVFRENAADGTLLLGGGAAILLQLADPRVARGVALHSDFVKRPLERLIRTLDYVYAIGFGSPELAAFAAAEVNLRHRPVHGPAKDDGPRYSAFDADAQKWVAATIVSVALQITERMRGPIADEDADIIVRSYGRLGGMLQARPADWPATRGEFDSWWMARVNELQVTDDAKRVADSLLAAQLPGHRLLLPPVRLITAALLPEHIRKAYGMNWTPQVAKVANCWLNGVSLVRPVIPTKVREAPCAAALRRVEARRLQSADIDVG